MDALQRDAVRYDTGDVNSSLGVRLDLVSAADDAFLAHPWLGVGVGNFGGYLETTPDCVESPAAFCRFDHAHSDLPEWAATMGIPKSEEHTSELQSLMRSSYAVFCLKKKKQKYHFTTIIKTTINQLYIQSRKTNISLHKIDR